MRKSFTFPCSLTALDRLRAETGGFCRAAGIPDIPAGEVELAVNEACTNIISHSGLFEKDTFTVAFESEKGAFTAVIRDHGREYDFHNAKTVKGPDELKATMPSSGMGVFFIQKLADSVSYRRLPNGENELTIFKKI